MDGKEEGLERDPRYGRPSRITAGKYLEKQEENTKNFRHVPEKENEKAYRCMRLFSAFSSSQSNVQNTLGGSKGSQGDEDGEQGEGRRVKKWKAAAKKKYFWKRDEKISSSSCGSREISASIINFFKSKERRKFFSSL